jgi:hypothetical protein
VGILGRLRPPFLFLQRNDRSTSQSTLSYRLVPRCAIDVGKATSTPAVKMGYRLAPVQLNIAESGFAEFRICNEYGEPITTSGFADEHEARIARALMIRAISKAVLIISHASVARQDSNLADDAMIERRYLSDQRK